MSASIPTVEPSTFAAGETVEWTKVVADYSNLDGWSLVYSIRGPTAFSDVTATNVSDGTYSVLISATSTALLEAGLYQWASHAYKAGPPILRYPVEKGAIYVTPNLVTTTTLETHASRTLKIINAAIEGRLTADMENYSIAGRQITKIASEKLYILKGYYSVAVWRERNPGKTGPSRSISFVDTR